jgi:hypothetical protein
MVEQYLHSHILSIFFIVNHIFIYKNQIFPPSLITVTQLLILWKQTKDILVLGNWSDRCALVIVMFMVSHKTHVLATCFHVGILLSFFVDPEDGGHMFLRNVV